MSLLDRLLGRRRAQPEMPGESAPPVDDELEAWVDAVLRLAGNVGAGGRLVLAVLGQTLADGRSSYWFGYEPTPEGLAALLTALGEEAALAEEVCALEVGMVGRRLGSVSAQTQGRWRAFVGDAIGDPEASRLLPARDQTHLDAETVWRQSASVQSRRGVQLDPEAALGQVRWYPGCPTRTLIGYSDPLNLAGVQRSAREGSATDEEWQAMVRAEEVVDREVDPLTWRLSSLSFVVASHRSSGR